MYSRSNCAPDSPGHWTSGDGEYAFNRGHAPGWYVIHRAHWDGHACGPQEIGHAATLTAAFAIAARHYSTPEGQWQFQVRP